MIYLGMLMTGKRVLFFFFVLSFIIISTYFVIKFAKGYRPDFSSRTFLPSGLLVATSIPDGGQIFIDGKLTSATNTTISLSPDTYEVEIKKDGFSSWKKKIKIEKELVTKTDAWLFPTVPDLSALTFTGALSPVLSPNGQRIVYAVFGSDLEKNGLWVLDLVELPFGISREPRQIVRSAPKGRDFSKSTYQWSPDSKQILVTLKVGKTEENFLLDAGVFAPSTQLVDVSDRLTGIFLSWQGEEEARTRQKEMKIPPALLEIFKTSTKDILFSPDETKILYTATASAEIKEGLVLSIPAASTQPQERPIKPGRMYVYDIKEDRNFYIMDEIKSEEAKISWFPSSRHLFLVEKEKVTILEYDGTNRVIVYAGAFEDLASFPFPSGTKFLILTSISANTPPNFYAVNLR